MKKLKHYLILLSLILPLFWSFSQNNISPEWLINSSGENWDVICDMVSGIDSNLIFAGNYTASSKINNRTTELTGDNNSFIVNLDNNGNELWQIHFISTDYSCITSLSCNNKGSVYACGTFSGDLYIGQVSLRDTVGKSMFILKLDNDGKVDMLQQIKGNFSNRHISITNNSQNELLLIASFRGNLNIENRNYESKYYYDILLAKIDNNGTFKEVSVLKGKGDDRINDIISDKEDNLYITGSFEKDLIFRNNKMKTKNNEDAFLIKLNNDFEFVYGKQIGGIYDDYGKSISIDNKGNVLLAGSFAGDLHLPEGNKLKSNGVLDVFLMKYDKNGYILWADSFGSGANDYVSSMSPSHSGNIYINGTYRGTIEKKNIEIESVNFSNDIFLAKYSTDGEFRFIETVGHFNVDFGRKLVSEMKGYFYLSGNFTEILKLLDKETIEAVEDDFFISRLYDCEESLKVKLPADTSVCGYEIKLNAGLGFEQYLWNQKSRTEEYIVDTSGVYIIEAIDKYGCVSSDTINVNINMPLEFDLGDTIIAMQGEIITLEAPGGMEEYLWSDGSSSSFLDINTLNIKPGEYIYWVEVAVENECQVTDEVTIDIIDNKMLNTHLISQNYTSSIQLFPNPVKNILNLIFYDYKSENNIHIRISTNDGSIIVEKEFPYTDINNGKIQLNLVSFPNGVYHLQIVTGEILSKHKIIKV